MAHHSVCKCKHSTLSGSADPWTSGATSTREIKPYPVQPTADSFIQSATSGRGIVSQPGVITPVPEIFPIPPAPTNLSDAVSCLTVDGLRELVANNAAVVNQRGFNGIYPLHRAALRGDPAIVELLLRNKADPNSVNEFSETPLHFACKRGNIVLMHQLIEGGADLRAEDRAGKGVLHHAAHGGSVLAAHYLTEMCGLQTRVRDRNLSTPAHIICAHGHMEAFEYFCKNHRCDVFDKDAQGNTLLHVAALCGNAAMCWRLLEIGGLRLLNELNSEGTSALDLAKRGASHKYQEIITFMSYFLSRKSKSADEPIRGPVLAWYGLLVLPILMYPATMLLASCFTNQGPVTLLGLVAMLTFRIRHEHRINHICRWASPAHAGMFFAGLLYTMICCYGILMPQLYATNSWLFFSSLVLAVIIIYQYVALLTRDPGIVRQPRQKTIDPYCGNSLLSSSQYYSIADVCTQIIRPNEFCIRCEIVPGPGTDHCRLCRTCYHHLDHHCLYLYRCIAANNHRLFIIFNIIVMTSICLFEYTCFLYFSQLYPNLPVDWALVSIVFASYPAIWSLALLNALSFLWGIWVLKIQILVITEGGSAKYYQSRMFRGQVSRPTCFQRLVNTLKFFTDKQTDINAVPSHRHPLVI